MNGIVSQLQGFYRGRRVLVTGHTGLKGAWLALWLERLGAEVHGIALPPPSPLSIYEASGIGTRMSSQMLDVRDLEGLKAAVARIRPEVVFHLAAQAIVGLSYEDPSDTFATNVTGSVHLLDAVRKVDSVRSVVMVTSDKCYQNVEQIWGYRETDRLGGDDPYSASKAAAEIAIAACTRSYFSEDPAPRIATARAGNVIGGGDWSQFRLVPDCIRALRAGEKIQLRNPASTRPWQFVLEPLGGYLLLGMRLCESRRHIGAWNFGPAIDNGATVERGTREIIRAWGGGDLEIVARAFHENQALQLDCTKARHALGWHTVLSFAETMEWTTAWYRAQHDGKDGPMLELSRTQLEQYERRIDAALSPV